MNTERTRMWRFKIIFKARRIWGLGCRVLGFWVVGFGVWGLGCWRFRVAV